MTRRDLMGVKSTIKMTRTEAIERYVSYLIKRQERTIRQFVNCYSNKELEKLCEEINDIEHNGEGFENYIIGEGV